MCRRVYGGLDQGFKTFSVDHVEKAGGGADGLLVPLLPLLDRGDAYAEVGGEDALAQVVGETDALDVGGVEIAARRQTEFFYLAQGGLLHDASGVEVTGRFECGFKHLFELTLQKIKQHSSTSLLFLREKISHISQGMYFIFQIRDVYTKIKVCM